MVTTLRVKAQCKTCAEMLESIADCGICGGRAFTHVVQNIADNGRALTSEDAIWSCHAPRCPGGHVIYEGPRP